MLPSVLTCLFMCVHLVRAFVSDMGLAALDTYAEPPFCLVPDVLDRVSSSVLTKLGYHGCHHATQQVYTTTQQPQNGGYPVQISPRRHQVFVDVRNDHMAGGDSELKYHVVESHDLIASRKHHLNVSIVPLPQKQELHIEDSVPLASSCRPALASVVDSLRPTTIDWRAWITPYQDFVPGAVCRNHSRAYLHNLANGTGWALQMRDASGKLPDGVLFGNLNALGSWDACLHVNVTLEDAQTWSQQERHFRGRICGVVLLNNPEAANMSRYHLPSAVRYGYCVPSSCGVDDASVSLNAALNGSGVMAVVGECHADSDATDFTAGDIALITLLGVVAAVVLVCTAADAVRHYRNNRRSLALHVYKTGVKIPPQGITGLISAFSLCANMKKLLNVQTGPDHIGCIHGLRFLSMAWVNIGHTYIIGFLLRPNSGTARLPEVIQPWPMQFIMNAFPAVDTFLMLGGCMFSYSLLKAVRAGRSVGPRKVLLMYINRYLRLTPVYAVVIWFSATLLHHCGRSMFASLNYRMFGITGCHKYWWRNLLYINNLYPSDTDTCMDQAWYLGLDFQLFIVAPILVLPYTRWPRFGLLWLAGWGAASIIVPGLITGVLHLPPTLLNMNVHATSPHIQHDFIVYVYNAPWSRASPYVVGLALGILLREVRCGTIQVAISRWLALLLWLVCTALALLVVLGMYRYNSDPQSMWTVAVAVSYAALHRPAWALAVAWLVLACATGRGGPVDALLSHTGWVPLSRLTFATYLSALQLQVWRAGQDRAPAEFSHTVYVSWFLADLVINVAIGLVLWLCFEAPAAALQTMLLGGNARRKPPNFNNKQSTAITLSAEEIPQRPGVLAVSYSTDSTRM